ncbi:hypothetical protein PFLUV_G00277730 [Perca fluviatilis]|uniref:Pyrin domain-containing protein n=1 Tax=Perca fluviatilis TaxID=8168 RepID=A0A6A5DMK1_PERFL|nr:hypothetical protein PFLUV_G00277730 [Perca fluviatilis]
MWTKTGLNVLKARRSSSPRAQTLLNLNPAVCPSRATGSMDPPLVFKGQLPAEQETTMMAVDLLNTLEDLKEDEFKLFKWYLQQQNILEGYQSIKESKLEKADRPDTVDVMVKTYHLHGALKVTKKVLEKINRNDLMQSLPDTSSGPEESVDVNDVERRPENRGIPSSQSKDGIVPSTRATTHLILPRLSSNTPSGWV